MKLCSYNEFSKMSLAEMENYLNAIYDGEPHRIIAEITEIKKDYLTVKALYLMIKGVAQEFIFFPDKNLSLIKIGKIANRIDDISVYCRKNNLDIGQRIICQVRTKTPDATGQVFRIRLEDIENNFEEIENFYQRYGISYEPKYIYQISENESLTAIIGGDFRNKLIADAKNILAKRDAEMAEKYSELNKRIAEVNEEVNEKNLQLKQLEENIVEATRKIESLKNDFKRMKNFYGLVDEETNSETISKATYYPNNFEEYISYWQGYLKKICNLSYREEILESVYYGLMATDQLILLTGSPGTGKTSLVRALPKCFGWENSAIIPVQSNWTDKSDLLGYYNPLEKNYMSTPFLDSLLKFCRKAKNSDGMFIICLDEMNLAHVEHYFAEFLSVLQSDRVIRLYSDELRMNIFRELKYNAIVHSEDDTKFNFDEQRFIDMDLEERKYYLQLCRMANMFFNYPATFTIPTNIKFFGTLNQDSTTLDISPKVIDRSFFIRVEKYDGDIKLDKSDAETDFDVLLNKMNSIIPISHRVRQQILRIREKMIDSKNLADILIASFLLPKIRFDSDTDRTKISALKNLCSKYTFSNEILEKYMTSSDENEIDYWRQ